MLTAQNLGRTAPPQTAEYPPGVLVFSAHNSWHRGSLTTFLGEEHLLLVSVLADRSVASPFPRSGHAALCNGVGGQGLRGRLRKTRCQNCKFLRFPVGIGSMARSHSMPKEFCIDTPFIIFQESRGKILETSSSRRPYDIQKRFWIGNCKCLLWIGTDPGFLLLTQVPVGWRTS